MKTLSLLLAACAAAFAAAPGDDPASGAKPAGKKTLPLAEAANPALRRQALEETAVPVRPGVPGKEPFWNGKSVQFLYAPAFDFKEVPGAVSYRFEIVPTTGGETQSFSADKPWAPLSPVWTKVPVGKATLTVTALDKGGRPVGEPASRIFHRAAIIAEEYPAAAMPWEKSARTALDALVHSPELKCWFTTGEPDAGTPLYRYPSKIAGAAASALALYASQSPAPADAEQARQAARKAADYLIGISYPKNDAWAYHPPTYHPTLYRELLKGHMAGGSYMTFCGAETGMYYLDVYAATKDPKYLDAAVKIAETYAARELPGGSWPLFVAPADGKQVNENVLVPTLVIEFLDRLGKAAGNHRFDAMRDRSLAWLRANPVRTWNWQGQFEDVKPLPPYENLTKHEAGDLAIHLFQSGTSEADRALALDLMRFSEDQYVMWDQPPADSPTKQSADGQAGAQSAKWLLPCVVEQYRCYAPVSASSAKLIRVFLAAYKATKDPLQLAKARALASTLTRTQSNAKAPGRYLTWLKNPSGPMWFNCETLSIQAMNELAAADPQPKK